jgi:hypothetical protein
MRSSKCFNVGIVLSRMPCAELMECYVNMAHFSKQSVQAISKKDTEVATQTNAWKIESNHHIEVPQLRTAAIGLCEGLNIELKIENRPRLVLRHSNSGHSPVEFAGYIQVSISSIQQERASPLSANPCWLQREPQRARGQGRVPSSCQRRLAKSARQG